MTGENPNFMEKDRLIAKLSAMRDGLNAIAAERQVIASAEEAIKKLQDLTQKQREEHSIEVKKATAVKEAAESQVRIVEEKESKLLDERRDVESTSPRRYGKISKGWLITIIFSFLFSPLCPLILFIAIKRKQGIRRRAQILAEIESRINENNQVLEEKKKELTKASRKLKEIIEQQPTDDELQVCIKKVEEEIKPECLAKIAEAEQFVAANAEGILEKEDWRNAGTLAFYLKTGRADSLKEALIMMIEQNQNEDLIKAIRGAAYSINSSVTRLSSSMEVYGNQINSAYRETARKFEESYSDIQYAMEGFSRSVSSQLSNLGSAIERQGSVLAEAEGRNADLLTHANQNSDELVRYITNHS